MLKIVLLESIEGGVACMEILHDKTNRFTNNLTVANVHADVFGGRFIRKIRGEISLYTAVCFFDMHSLSIITHVILYTLTLFRQKLESTISVFYYV